MSKQFKVAVVGATGAVGETMLKILAERRFPATAVHAVASARTAGTQVSFGEEQLVVEALDSFDFEGIDIGLFSPGAAVSKIHAPRAAAQGCVVIDNTSQFRYDDDVPLIVPEVNPQALPQYRQRRLIANPNCSTIQLVVALQPIYAAVGIERINIATYQAVSGSGKEAMEELTGQTGALLNAKAIASDVYPKQIAFNCLPHIDVFQDNGYTKEEMKVVWETRKIMGDERIGVNATCVRVPVFYGHSEAVHIETRDKISANEVRDLLNNAPGICVLDECNDGGYPTAATEADGQDPVFVGRIREDISHPRGIDLWVVSDNLRKGAALNSIQIAELLVKSHL